ncbi:MAG: ABC transporter permease [Pseudanabaenaceae cyanobacterium SKYGB_i_bin29]|nr:ABC transporter permease [Pseudanabaenaceae cyanobacterium SKYG29]MDW8421530.1 ABC transporter permease [Pseudanabaenaceae cyanobacterium SKYGB_i_bin29]
MHIGESIKMAWQTLSANRLRSFLTMLGIVIGNASVIAMIGVGEGGKRYAAGQFQSLGTNVLFVITGSDSTRRNILNPPPRLVLSDAEAIAQQVPTVKAVAPEVRGTERATFNDRFRTTPLIGTTPEYSQVRDVDTYMGRFFNHQDLQRRARVVTLGCDTAKLFFGSLPSTVPGKETECKKDSPNPVQFLINPIGQHIRIRGTAYEVIGIMESKGAFLGFNQDDTILLPLTTMVSRLGGRNTSPYGIAIQVINISAKDDRSVSAAKFQVENLLKLRHQTDDTFTIRTQKDAIEIVGNVTTALTAMLAAIAGISLLVGGIGIMNIMLVSVAERTQEIGLRKAIGASQRDILTQFLIEAVILGTIGGILGTSLGIGGIILVAALTPLETTISVGAIWLAVGVSSAIGLFFGVFPARQAARLDPIVALRSNV